MLYQLCFYVPESHADVVKDALFAAGAGRIGNYDCCAWQTRGEGQFRPLPGSNAFIGQTLELERVPEMKVELVCDSRCLGAALDALREAHPYETPAFAYWPVNDATFPRSDRS